MIETAVWFDSDSIVMIFGVSSGTQSSRFEAFKDCSDQLAKRGCVDRLQKSFFTMSKIILL